MQFENSIAIPHAPVAPAAVRTVRFGGSYRLPAPVKTDSPRLGGSYRLPTAR